MSGHLFRARHSTRKYRGAFELSSIFVVLALLISSCLGRGEPIQSGPELGKELPSMFHPLIIAGEDTGKERCLL